MGLLTDAVFSVTSGAMDLTKAAGNGISSLFNTTDLARGKGPGLAITSDPYVWSFAGGMYVEKPLALSYTMLRYLAKRDPVVAAIILTRLRQCTSFASIRSHEETSKSIGKGFRVRLKQGAGKKRTKVVEKKEDEYNNFVLYCARKDVEPEDCGERHFAQFMWKFIKDRLTMDQAVAENVFDRKGSLTQFLAVDGSTMRKVSKGSKFSKEIKYVQVYNARVIQTFDDRRVAFCPENLSTELTSYGYGESEIEYALKLIMTRLSIDESNSRMFHPASLGSSGILVTKNAELTQQQVENLEARWRAEIGGARGRHRVPVLGLPRG